MSSRLHKVLVIDDEASMRKLLRMSLEQYGLKVITASNGKEGLFEISNSGPDLILLDLGLPDITGMQVLKEAQLKLDVPIIVVSALDDTETVVEALQSGADDYVTKPFHAKELFARIQVSLRRSLKRDFPEQVINCGHLRIDLGAMRVYKDDREVKLTSTEFDLLKLFLKHQNRVITIHQILHSVWGANVDNTQYPRVYVRYLRQKLERDPEHPELIINEPGIGYRFCTETDDG